MFQTLDLMISLSVVFLILSMVLKYIMAMIKRVLKTKANVIAEEMETFVGENTSKYLIPYLEKKAKHLNLLEIVKKAKKDTDEVKGLRQLTKDQLKEVVNSLRNFLKDKSSDSLKEELAIERTDEEIKGINDYLEILKTRIEGNYDNTLQKISERYESNLRKYTLIFGLIFALLINADFFQIYSSFSRSSLARGTLAAQAEMISGQMNLISSQIDRKVKEGITELEEFKNETKETVETFTDTISDAELRLGWKTEDFESDPENTGFEIFCLFLKKLLGIVISGLLISFGAPFWHDFLGSVVGVNKILRSKAG